MHRMMALLGCHDCNGLFDTMFESLSLNLVYATSARGICILRVIYGDNNRTRITISLGNQINDTKTYVCFSCSYTFMCRWRGYLVIWWYMWLRHQKQFSYRIINIVELQPYYKYCDFTWSSNNTLNISLVIRYYGCNVA